MRAATVVLLGLAPWAMRPYVVRLPVEDRPVVFCRFEGTHTPDPLFPVNMLRFFREHAL